MGSDLLKFEAAVTIQKSGDFSFKTPKVRLLVSELEGGYYLYDWSLLRVLSLLLCALWSPSISMSPSLLTFGVCVSEVHRFLFTWQTSLIFDSSKIPVAFGVLEGQEVHLSLCVPCSYPMMLMRLCLFTCMLSLLTRKLTASYKVGGIWGRWGKGQNDH